MSQYTLNSPFSLEDHIKTFTNYLEVVIHPDGSVHYASPSHQEYLINFLCKRDGITREELMDRTPREYYCDFMTWLTKESGCVSVWNEFIVSGKLTKEQLNTLKTLKEAGVYRGTLGEKMENKTEYNINLNIPLNWDDVTARIKKDATERIVFKIVDDFNKVPKWEIDNVIENLNLGNRMGTSQSALYILASLVDKAVDQLIKEKMDKILTEAIDDAVERILKRKAFRTKLDELDLASYLEEEEK